MSEIKRFTLDANIDGMDQMREFVLASDFDARVHDLETMCDPAGLTAENALLRDQTRMLDAMIGRLKRELESVAPTQGADARPVATFEQLTLIALGWLLEASCDQADPRLAAVHLALKNYVEAQVDAALDAAPSVTQEIVWNAYNMCPDHIQGQPARMRWMAEFINATIAPRGKT